MSPLASRPTDTSTTNSRSGAPTCGAANPTPGAAYIVSIMSSMRRSISGVNSSTARATVCSAESPYLRIGRIIGSVSQSRNNRHTADGQRRDPRDQRIRRDEYSLWEPVHAPLDALIGKPLHIEVDHQSYLTA